jgi:hypothetical protein
LSVDYAEATKLEQRKNTVSPGGIDAPRQPNSPNFNTKPPTPSQQTVPSRDSDLGRPNNLPERQNSLRNDGQYRTNPTPNTTAKAPPPKVSNQLGLNGGAEAALAEAAYYAGFFISGAIDGAQNQNFPNDSLRLKRSPLEDLSYEAGRRSAQEARDLTEDAIKNSQKLLDDLWRNKLTFEIPQIKIPKFDLPELPKLKPPEFPEFKFPEISFPKPQPPTIPKPQLKPPTASIEDVPLTGCGSVTFIVAISYKWDEAFGLRQRCSTSEHLKVLRKNNPIFSAQFDSDLELLVKHNENGGGDSLAFSEGIYHSSLALNDSTNGGYPAYRTYSGSVEGVGDTIRKTKNKLIELSVFEEIPDFLALVHYGRGLSPEHLTQCAIPKFNPNPSPPPPPPKDDCCRMGCCPKPTEIDYRLIKRLMEQTLKEQKFTIEVPICKCEFNNETKKWTPKTDNVRTEVFATSQQQAEQLSQLHLENARQAADLCIGRNVEEPVAAIPQSWQIRHEGGKPQLVIHCAEKKQDGKYGSAMYPITVPHWRGTINDKPSLPAYKKGNWEGILVLADNTKVTINAANEAECTKILNAIKPWIKKEMLKNSYFKGGKINIEIKPTQVKPMYGRYFQTGQKNNKPDWRVDFP